jgi:hypothetical protein
VVFDLYRSLAGKLRIPLPSLCRPWLFVFLVILVAYAGTVAFILVQPLLDRFCLLRLASAILDLLHRMCHCLLWLAALSLGIMPRAISRLL